MLDIPAAAYAYLECAVWASTFTLDGWDTVPMDECYMVSDLAPETVEAMRTDMEHFYGNLDDDIREAVDARVCSEQFGHDFWLTRNHHGAGFWDRGLGDLGDQLTAIAHAYGECDLYVGDDGLIYCQ